MERSVIALAVFGLSSVAYPMDDLFESLTPNKERNAIKRAEISYEETCYFAKANRCRVAKINTDLLQQRNATFTITAFEDLTPAGVESGDIERIRSGTQRWTGRWEDSVPEAEFPRTADSPKPGSSQYNLWRDDWDRELNQVSLELQSFVLNKADNTWGFVPNGWERAIEQHSAAAEEKRRRPSSGPDLSPTSDPNAGAAERMRERAYDEIKGALDNARIVVDGVIRPPPEPNSRLQETYYVVSLHNRDTASIANNDIVLIYALDREKIFNDDYRCDQGQCADGQAPPVTQRDIERQQKARAFEDHMNLVKQRIAEENRGGPQL